VVDDRNVYDGGKYADQYSGHRIYYKRGSGKYSLGNMHQVNSMEELETLINTPTAKLPKKARGSLPPPPPRSRDKARKERNKDKLREQAKLRRERAKEAQ
jgi:hypothetical protein